MKIVTIGSLFALGLGLAATPAAATVVNIDAIANAGLTSASGVTLSLGAGTYSVTPIIDKYTAFSRFASVIGCDGAGTHCFTGYEHSYLIDVNGVSTGYGDNNGAGGLGPQPGGGYYDTMAKAFALGAKPATFTLLAPGTVTFYIFDDVLGDNSGGVSLNVTGVPEAATWAMLIAGFGLVGAVARRRLAAMAG